MQQTRKQNWLKMCFNYEVEKKMYSKAEDTAKERYYGAKDT